MNIQRTERFMQVLAVIGIWFAIGFGWAFKGRQVDVLTGYGADLPAPTKLWFDWADSWAVLVVPVACTVLVVALRRRRSPHANWVASLLLFAGLLYGAIGQVAGILPMFKLCSGPV